MKARQSLALAAIKCFDAPVTVGDVVRWTGHARSPAGMLTDRMFQLGLEFGDTIPIRPAVAPLNAPPRIQPQGRQPGCFVVPTPRDVAIPKSGGTIPIRPRNMHT